MLLSFDMKNLGCERKMRLLIITVLLSQLIGYSCCMGVSTRTHSMLFNFQPKLRKILAKRDKIMMKVMTMRGGGDTSDDPIEQKTPETGMMSEGRLSEDEKIEKSGKTRYGPEVICDILKNHGDVNEESLELRKKIVSRANDYLAELHDETIKRPPSPLKVLHKMAPKIPAIKHSPDILLRIQTARGDIDSGVAASLIATMARLCTEYDNKTGKSVGKDIIKDRRFEQLVECVNCGVDVRKRRVEAQKLMAGGDDAEIDMEDLLDEGNIKINEGISVLDACRAAWGISMLGGYHLESFGGQRATDILIALSLRNREQLLARLQMQRHGEVRANNPSQSLEEDFDFDSGTIAKDVASSIWTFACVKASTGLRTVPLFEACCSILCQNPAALRERELTKKSEDLDEQKVQDVIDKLAQSDESEGMKEENDNKDIDSGVDDDDDRDALIHWLSPNEVSDIMWAVAVHGRTDDSGSKQEMNLSETATALSEIAFDVIEDALKRDLLAIKASKNKAETDKDCKVIEHHNETTEVLKKEYVKQDNGAVVEVVDAAALLSEEPTDSLDETSMEEEEEERSVLKKGYVKQDNGAVVEVVDAAALLSEEPTDSLDETSMEERSVLKKEYVKQDNGAVVEVVDAAALLSEEPTDSLDETSMDEEQRTVSPITENVQEVYVVNGDALIASERQDQEVEVDTEVVYTKTTSAYSTKALDIQFSNSDLCSIAWAATDLKDSLRNIFVDLITEILAQQGSHSMMSLHGGDLSNLAWAIARRTSFTGYIPDEKTVSRLLDIFEWITIRSLSFVEQKNGNDLLHYFQAPEIGRMMWSLAISLSKLSPHTADRRKVRASFHKFALISLQTAAHQSSMFGTEDLARVVWGFLELSDLEEVFQDPKVSAALGRILSITEQSIIRWESGQCEKQQRNQNTTQLEEPVNFNSFLGMPRIALKFLNQRVDTKTDDDEPHPFENEKSLLPLLRDLSMDPATMCKLACSLSRINVMFPEISCAWTFVRVAVRLMAAKNGQLLKENTPSDNVRLAFGCASNDVAGYGREITTRHYARRLVQYLNQRLVGKDYDFVSDRLGLSPQELSTLVWSLGELGVKHWQIEEGTEGSAYKKLRLVSNVQLLSKPQLKSLSTHSSVKLLHGAISMEILKSSPDIIRSLLHDLEIKLKYDSESIDFCKIVECLVYIKGAIGEVEIITTSSSENMTETKNLKQTATRTGDIKNMTKQGTKDDSISTTHDNSLSSAILASTHLLLNLVAEIAMKSFHLLSANQMRRLLQAYVGLSFQVEDFIDAAEIEIQKRLGAANFVSNRHKSADRATKSSWDALADKSNNEGGSPLAALRKKLKKVFSHSPENDVEVDTESEDGQEDPARLQEFADLLKDIYDSPLVSKLTNGNPERSVLSTEKRHAVFEMSRCQELILSYRRVDFSTGRRHTRHDLKRREIGKNVVSRMLK